MGDVNTSAPEPFVFSPSQAWDGNDGRWSSFIVRVGTPEQTFRIFPATSGHETFIPVPEGCTESDPSNCGSLRGAYPFNGKDSDGFAVNASSTWKPIGLYSLTFGNELGMEDNGLYGFDKVGLTLDNSGGLELDSQIVAGIATKNFYVGLFGLGPKPSNFSDFQYPQPSFMRTLKDQNKIPSLSFAYTAGAAYRIPKIPGSLTLGGHDTARYTANEQTFPFSNDDSKVLSVGVQRITAMNTLSGSRSFLDTPIFSLIDSSFPHIWLPRKTCDAFEEAFGLRYDAGSDLYLINDTMREKLQDLQPTVTFSLGNENDASKLVSIQLPYGAFDLQASHSIFENETNYFPIRRAANDTQFLLGRTFLQEAYVIADYERSNFSIHQALFKNPMPAQNIVTITTPLKASNGTTGTNSSAAQGRSGLSTPAVAGIAVGGAVLLIVFALVGFFLYRRRRRRRRRSEVHELDRPRTPQVEMSAQEQGKYEMYQAHPEMVGSTGGFELDGRTDVKLMSDDGANRAVELPGAGARHELPAGYEAKLTGTHEMEGSGVVAGEHSARQKHHR
jgi:hypothetical protein